MDSGLKSPKKWVFPKIGLFPPKASILIEFSIINHPFWGVYHPYFWKQPNKQKSSFKEPWVESLGNGPGRGLR